MGKLSATKKAIAAALESKYSDQMTEYAQKMPYVHNTQPNQFDVSEKRFGMHVEPAGQYITPLDSVPDKPPVNAYMQYGEKTFSKPLVIDFGATDYNSAKNWKKRLILMQTDHWLI